MISEIASQSIRPSKTLTAQDWQERKLRHENRVDELTADYLEARSHHKKQPVMDFLFEYFQFRPSALRRWSPGFDVALEFTSESELPPLREMVIRDGHAWLDLNQFPTKRLNSVRWMLQLLKNSQEKRPSFGCFGMHEWAMVYKTDAIRHAQLGLRMEPEELAAFVESRPLVCTHFDAFRFFTPEAVPLNKFQLSRETFADTEQPGCIHSNMDLYKWAYKLYPWISSDLLLEAFELAVEARTIDMQASPYDLAADGLPPIKIETEAGRAEYLEAQHTIYEKGLPIRQKLIEVYEGLVAYIA